MGRLEEFDDLEEFDALLYIETCPCMQFHSFGFCVCEEGDDGEPTDG